MGDSNSKDESDRTLSVGLIDLLDKLIIRYSARIIMLSILIIANLILTIIYLSVEDEPIFLIRISLLYLITLLYILYIIIDKVKDYYD